MPRNIIWRISFVPITALLILVVNFFIVHTIKDPLNSSYQASFSKIEESSHLEHRGDDYEQQGLHLPIAFNTSPFLSDEKIKEMVRVNDPHLLKCLPYIYPKLVSLSKEEPSAALIELILMAKLSSEAAKYSFEKDILDERVISEWVKIESWLKSPGEIDLTDHIFNAEPLTLIQKVQILFCETRLYRYFSKVLRLDFGTLRDDPNQKVTHVVLKRLRSSMLLLSLPLLVTFIFSQVFGLIMALKQRSSVDMVLSAFFVTLYAIPLYIMIPLIIEKVGLRFHLPIHGLGYKNLSNFILPFFALSYGALAIYSRIHKALYLNLLSQEHLKCVKAKGISQYSAAPGSFEQRLFLGSLSFFMGSLVSYGAFGNFCQVGYPSIQKTLWSP